MWTANHHKPGVNRTSLTLRIKFFALHGGFPFVSVPSCLRHGSGAASALINAGVRGEGSGGVHTGGPLEATKAGRFDSGSL